MSGRGLRGLRPWKEEDDFPLAIAPPCPPGLVVVGVESVGALLRDGSRGYERERGEISLRLSLFPQTFDDIIHCNAIWGGQAIYAE